MLCQRECDEIMEKTNQYAAYLEENTGCGVYYSTQL
jgi:hypothetical protein